MELKEYQRNVLNDLSDYLEQLRITNSIEASYQKHWENRYIRVGTSGLPNYNNSIPGTPHVCFKVPTGGGKTFIACAAAKLIFEAIPDLNSKVIVWLVPSNTILEQTIRNLKDSNHPYRQRLELDFNGRVEVYTKEELLNGQNFNPASIEGQLSICILSFDSLRSNRKDGRKVYQENGSLQPFLRSYTNTNTLIENIDESALIQVLNQLSPVVIVDESHNAQSDLSVEMLNNLNPSFVLDLTATPRKNSNIISYVGASELKKENMVKLPVIVYNQYDKQDVLENAIRLRRHLEDQAKNEEGITGKYVRPIVLFQAQPKIDDDSETFKKLKAALIEMSVPQDQIAIKTADLNEIKNIDLMSKNCPIRYIITVNALKEGWDCPFAYILATLANKTSPVDVEQILGRILRQPYATQHNQPLMNMSYVLTCSNDFRTTLENIVKGLNAAGFSRKDFRVGSEETAKPMFIIPEDSVGETKMNSGVNATELGFNSERIERAIGETENGSNISLGVEEIGISEMIKGAEEKGKEFLNELEKSSGETVPSEIGEFMNSFGMNDRFKDEASKIRIPIFYLKTEPSKFTMGSVTPLTKEALVKGFTLRDKDIAINFEAADSEIFKVDVEGSGDTTPKYEKLGYRDQRDFKGYFDDFITPGDTRISASKKEAYRYLNRIDSISSTELKAYSDRVIDNMSKEKLSALIKAPHEYVGKIKDKIVLLESEYCEQMFYKMVDSGEITCAPNYALPDKIHPIKCANSISKSLYNSEGEMNNLEFDVITLIASLENVKWWHRILDHGGNSSFHLNGFLNHYPDFIVMTNNGKLILVETKGADRDNTDSRRKLKLGKVWENRSGLGYRYFMVVEGHAFDVEGVHHIDDFIEIMKKL